MCVNPVFADGIVKVIFTRLKKNPIDLGKLSNVELALLKSWGSHSCSALENDGKNFKYTITRKNATPATLQKALGILKGFAFSV